VIVSAGISAGIDMSLHVVARLLVENKASKQLATWNINGIRKSRWHKPRTNDAEMIYRFLSLSLLSKAAAKEIRHLDEERSAIAVQSRFKLSGERI